MEQLAPDLLDININKRFYSEWKIRILSQEVSSKIPNEWIEKKYFEVTELQNNIESCWGKQMVKILYRKFAWNFLFQPWVQSSNKMLSYTCENGLDKKQIEAMFLLHTKSMSLFQMKAGFLFSFPPWWFYTKRKLRGKDTRVPVSKRLSLSSLVSRSQLQHHG